MPTLYLVRELSAIPTAATTVSPVPNLNISQSCCSVRVRVAFFFFFVFFYCPGGPHGPKYIFKRPGHTVDAPGRIFTPAKS